VVSKGKEKRPLFVHPTAPAPRDEEQVSERGPEGAKRGRQGPPEPAVPEIPDEAGECENAGAETEAPAAASATRKFLDIFRRG